MKNIPIEVSREILTHLCEDRDGRKALVNYSCCSRYFHDIAEPVLYSTFVQTGKEAIPLILRTVSTKPHLAKHVRHFTVSVIHRIFSVGGTIAGESLYNSPVEIDTGHLALESLLQDDGSITQRRSWLKQITEETVYSSLGDSKLDELFVGSNWDAAVALLLVLFSQGLESFTILNFGNSYEWDAGLPTRPGEVQPTRVDRRALDRCAPIAWILKEMLSTPGEGYLHRLRRFSMSSELDAKALYAIKLLEVSPFLRLASMTHFTLTGMAFHSRPYADLFDHNRSYNTTSLTLKSCNVVPVIYHLSSFVSLKRFEFSHSMPPSIHCSFKDVPRALAGSAHSLETLILYQPDIFGQNIAILGSCRQPTRELQEFKKLRFLDVDINTLVGLYGFPHFQDPHVTYLTVPVVNNCKTNQQLDYPFNFPQTLPPVLEHLIVRRCTAFIFDHLHELFLEGEDSPRSLKSVKLYFHPNEDIQDTENTNWEEVALRNGIVLAREYETDDLYVRT